MDDMIKSLDLSKNKFHMFQKIFHIQYLVTNKNEKYVNKYRFELI